MYGLMMVYFEQNI